MPHRSRADQPAVRASEKLLAEEPKIRFFAGVDA
jgi:hypothetical protein